MRMQPCEAEYPIDAASIGYSASHGCIRMRISDAEWLFEHVELGTPVVIVSA